jgi:hypothetical protein
VLETLAPSMARYPSAFGHALGAADMVVNGAVELAIVGDPSASDFIELNRAGAEQYIPSLVVAGGSPTEGVALLAGREARDGKATAYLCRNYSCDTPVTSANALIEQIENLRHGAR